MNAPIEFLDSSTQDVSQTMLIGVAGTTGSGKTESALRIASGIAGDNFAVIDSEHKRALNKKNRYKFRHFDMQPPYSPEAYHEVISAAVKAGFKAIVIDSFSAEWDDEGGLSDIAAAALERMSKGDPARAEALTGLAWKDPKVRHRKLMRYLRKQEMPIIFCLRAEPKIKYIKEYDEKKGREITKVVDAGWLPIAEKLFGYDMLIYALMMPENPGIPVHLKKLEPEFESMFPVGKIITEQCGKLLAQWASGAKPQPSAATQNIEPSGAPLGSEAAASAAAADGEVISPEEAVSLETWANTLGAVRKFKLKFSIDRFGMLPSGRLAEAKAWLQSAADYIEQAQTR